jgi:preprotein translocase subunit SecD
MRQRAHLFLLGIIILAIVAVFVDLAGTAGKFTVFGHGTAIHQGLDLTGGLSMELKATDPKAATADAMSAAIDIITKRVNAFGVSEPVVTQLGNDAIDVEMPGVKDPEVVRQTIGSTGQLVLYGMGSLNPLQDGATFPYSNTTTLCDAKNAPSPCVVMKGSELDSSQIGSNFDQYGQPIVTFGAKGGAVSRLSSYTTDHVGQYMAFVLDGKVVTDPQIKGAITGGNGEINNIGSSDVAKAISIRLKYGALPIAFTAQASSQISATLGSQYVHDSITAAIVGILVVMFFMIANYRLPGLVADVALLIYTAFTFAVFKLWPFSGGGASGITLTLAGIAGFILSIGMAVDANVLIFERLKEELRAGKTLGAAIEAGFNRAWTSIRDSNVSTIITCCVLYWFGQNYGATVIAGFATTLGIGVAVSMFTAIVVTRTFLRVLVRSNSSYHPKWFGAGLENLAPPTRPTKGVRD